jgi:D-alanine--poly(phosphoribitol) ligase subunit 2
MNRGPQLSDDILAGVSELLVSVTGVEEIATAPDLKIRELGILDSLGVVSLIIGLCERFSIDIAPAEIEEEDVATPEAIAGFVRRKLDAATP